MTKEHYPDSDWPNRSAAENIFYWGRHYQSDNGVINGVNGQAKKRGKFKTQYNLYRTILA